MNRRGLMARLASRTPARSIAVQESIYAHLRDLFNSSFGLGYSPIGAHMPPIADMIRNFPQGTDTLKRCIEATIEAYEPRLAIRSVAVTQGVDEPKIYIEIQGVITSLEDQPVMLLSELDSRGSMSFQ